MKNIDAFPCIIPARFNSERFPGKPFALINGVPMLERVVENARNAKLVSSVTVAAYGPEVASFCEERDIPYVAVDVSCKNGSEAVADVVAKSDVPYAFELQGDQPIVFAEIIDEFLLAAKNAISQDADIDIVQPYARITQEQKEDPDVVKVIVSENGQFIDFSRKPVDTDFRTLGLYVWKRESLLAFPSLEISEHEREEATHLIRFTENNMKVQGIELDDTDWVEVDREEHIQAVEKVLAKKR